MSWRPRSRRLAVLGVLGFLVFASIEGAAQVRKHLDPNKPRPDVADLRYGPYERNVLDIWKAPAAPGHSGPTPLVIFFHGGGFIGGDKSSVPAWLVDRCLAQGISVASANYRLSTQAPYPAPMLDGARAIQFLRFKAKELGIDPKRIAACGNSAGAGIALWAGFHDDLADPGQRRPGAPPVVAAGVPGAGRRPDVLRPAVHQAAHRRPGSRARGAQAPLRRDLGRRSRQPRVHRLYEESSALNYVSPDDPPVILFYSEPDVELPADAAPGKGIHHPRFGAALKAMLDPLGVECVLRHDNDYRGQEHPRQAMFRDLVDFFAQHLR